MSCGQTAAAEFLLLAGADAQAVDSKMKNCLHLAVENQQLETLNMLLDKDEVCENLFRTDVFERTPLHYAAFNENHQVLLCLIYLFGDWTSAPSPPPSPPKKENYECNHQKLLKKKIMSVTIKNY